jgi:hypothetical protein
MRKPARRDPPLEFHGMHKNHEIDAWIESFHPRAKAAEVGLSAGPTDFAVPGSFPGAAFSFFFKADHIHLAKA